MGNTYNSYKNNNLQQQVERQWQWNDVNSWHNFDKSTNEFVENNRLSQNKSIFVCRINNKDYIINLNKSTQKNTHTGFQRKIRWISNGNNFNKYTCTSVKWQFEWKNNHWIDFKKCDSILIENARRNGSKTTEISINNTIYEINIVQLFRKNVETGSKRTIRAIPSNFVPNSKQQSGNNGNNGNNNSKKFLKWQWLTDDDKSWIDFFQKDSISIENARHKGENTTKITIENEKYDINIGELYQKNVESGKILSIRCVPHTVQSGAPNYGANVKGYGKGKSDKWTGPCRKTFGRKIMTLYHVTDKAGADGITKGNIMLRGSQGKFGGGIYFAETAAIAKSKAKSKGYLVTCLVLVGDEHIVNARTKITFQQLCKLKKDSVWAKKYKERVVYNWDQCKVLSVQPA